MARADPTGHPRSSALVALPLAWSLALLVLGGLVWFDYQQVVQHQESLSRQTVNAGAQSTALYLQNVVQQLYQLAEREQALLERIRRSGAPDALARLVTSLEYRFPNLEGYALTDRNGAVLAAMPSDHPTPEDARTPSSAPPGGMPVALLKRSGDYAFRLHAPWGGENVEAGGRLWVTIGCAFLCRSLDAQTPDGHYLRLELLRPETSAAGPITAAAVPGTTWFLVDTPDGALIERRLARDLALALALLTVFVSATLLLYALVKRKTRVLEDDSERYRELFMHGAMAELLADPADGRIREANKAATQLFAHPAAQLRDNRLSSLLGLSPDAFETQMQRVCGGTGACFAAEFAPRDGERRELEVHASEIAVGDRSMIHVTAMDVTDRMRSLRALSENEAKLRAVLDASADGLVMTDDQQLIQLFSPAAEMMFGYLAEEMTGRHIRALLPDCFAAEGAHGGSCFATGAASGTVRETAGRRKNGSPIPLRVSISHFSLEGRLHFLALIQDLTEQKRNQAQLTYLERHDVLTGLLNRREFERRLDALLSFSEQTDTEYVLCYMDVDQFKVINDTCGHQAGDELIKQLAMLIRSHLRETENVARMGGDEFGVLLVDCDATRGEAICNGLLGNIRNFLFTWQDQSFDVAISMGIAAFHPHGSDVSQVLSQADVACHMAKSLGRDRVHVYHQGDADLIRHHSEMHLVSVISQALNEGRFHLFAQPIAPVAAGRNGNFHYEVLVRMVDAQGELVIPDQFIPAAERYILMPAIDRWVINRLFRLQAENLRRWAGDPGVTGFLFGINLSGTSLTDEGFLSYLKRQFEEHRIPHRAICFEITETAAITNLERARTLIDEMRALGCSFALDDFGTGLSSYAYLKLLPVDYLKIDGSFVRNMTDDPVDYAMVDSINQIGHILGLKTIAEWAETPGTLTQLRALNVDYAQGFGVGELISVEQFQFEPARRSVNEKTR